MDKIWIVLQSEFLRRVQSRFFVLTTLLAPILLIGIAVVPGIMAAVALEGNERTVAVIDETGALFDRLQSATDEQFVFMQTSAPAESLRAAVQAGRYDAYLRLPAGLEEGAGEAVYYSSEGGGLSARSRIEEAVDQAVRQHRLDIRQAPPEVLEVLRSRVPVRMVKLTDEGEAADSSVTYSVIGYILGFILYMTMFIYGSFVMQGVIEEKSTRVVEVMISSVRPFQLLMGKVLGIGAMGLLQMAIWSVLILAGITFAGQIMALFIDPSAFDLPVDASRQEVLRAADLSIPDISPMVFVWFILFFLGGYLLYSSLFAAIGSAVEQPQDAQGLMLPVSMLIIIPILFMAFIIESPNSTLSIVLSIIPFFSPILMVVRYTVTEVPFWEMALSFFLLVGAFIGAVWISSRIYRVGILMYGKKPALKDLIRWFRYA